MRLERRIRHRGSTCNPMPAPLVGLFLFISILSTIQDLDLFLSTTMAWTIRRSYYQLASRLQSSSSSSSLFSFTAPTRASAITFRRDLNVGTKRRIDHQCTSRSRIGVRTTTSISPTRLYSYQDFLKEDHDSIFVSYFTDIEGDKLYLDRYVEKSKILTWIPNDEKGRDEKSRGKLSLYCSEGNTLASLPYERRIEFCDSNSMIVFGGDLWDKGGFDLYVTRQLLDLKRRYPNRVVWVLGNRDINKLRMPQELGFPDPTTFMSSSETHVPYHPGLIWFRGSGRVGDPDGTLPSMNPGERLKWLLGNTMGSPDAMEHRRQELLWETKGCREDNSRCINASEAENIISDNDVVRSYQESCHPRGEMGQFLSEGLLAAKVGPILFVHGSLPLTKETMTEAKENQSKKSIWDDLTFCMPWINKTHYDYGEGHKFATASDFGVKTIEDWLKIVNAFCVQNVEAWKNDISQLEDDHKIDKEQGQNKDDPDDRYKEESKDSIWAYRAGYGNGPSYCGTYYSDLVQYGMGMIPGGKKNPTVVYNSFTPDGMPTLFLPPEEQNSDDKNGNPSGSQVSSESDVAICTRDFFEQSTIKLILTGHKPQGDMPSPIRVDQSSWVICADTSYSGDTKWFHNDRNATTPEKMEHRRLIQERRRSNLGRGDSVSFRGETAVSEVLVELSKGATSLKSIRYHGVLSDGTDYESVDLLDADADDVDSGACHHNNQKEKTFVESIGKVAPMSMVPDPSASPHEGRWWTKSICRDGSRLYSAGEGYNVWNYFVSPNSNESDDDDLKNS